MLEILLLQEEGMESIALIITGVAKSVGIAPGLLLAVCMTETNLRNIDSANDGGSPSYGICQVKLKTARWMGKVHKKPELQNFTEADMRDVRKNATVAALYIKYQLNRYAGDTCKAVAAYNAGKFKESSVYLGLPFNWSYVQKVKKNAPEGSVAEQRLGCFDEPSLLLAQD